MYLSPTELIAFLLTTLAVMATPGVTVSSIVGVTLSRGVGSGLAMELGVNLARLSMMILLALGLGAVSEFMAFAYDWIKIAGALYLVWLGIKAIRSPLRLNTPAGRQEGSAVRRVLQGFLVLWGNPKAFIFFGAFIPHFIHADAPLVPQVAVLAAIWVAIASVTDTGYILLAGTARRTAAGSTSPIINWVSGIILICAGAWLALSQKA